VRSEDFVVRTHSVWVAGEVTVEGRLLPAIAQERSAGPT
jgi:hypothetical protein